MSKRRLLLLLALVALFSSSGSGLTSEGQRATSPPAPESVSLVALIANPDRYDGKTVQVVGVLNIGFEMDALCLTIEHALEGGASYCAALEFKGLRRDGKRLKEWIKLAEWSKEYVVIEGTMKNSEGFLNPIVIRDVSRVAPVPFESPIEWRADREQSEGD